MHEKVVFETLLEKVVFEMLHEEVVNERRDAEWHSEELGDLLTLTCVDIFRTEYLTWDCVSQSPILGNGKMQKVVGWDCPLGATLSGKPSLDELTIWRSKALVVGGEAKWQCAILAQATSSLWDNQLPPTTSR